MVQYFTDLIDKKNRPIRNRGESIFTSISMRKRSGSITTTKLKKKSAIQESIISSIIVWLQYNQ